MTRQYRPGDVVLLSFPFSDGTAGKRRPALVLLDTGDDDIVVARITSQIPPTNFDIVLVDWQQAGLLLPSVARLHKLATLEKSLVTRHLGRLTPGDWAQVRSTVQRLWSSI
jgi:mRNA interferase MazF